MSVNAITANNPLVTVSPLAKQYQPTLGEQSSNSVFKRDSLSLGNVASPYQTYTKSIIDPKDNSWSIEDHYLCAPEEVGKKLEEILQDIKNTDFSGMTDIERYNCIENKFIDAFGKDFPMAHNLRLWGTGYSGILPVFEHQVSLQVGGWGEVKVVNFKRLYGDIGVGEVRELIRAKYPDNLTNRDYFLMMGEMDRVGVADAGVYNMPSSYIEVLVDKSTNNAMLPMHERTEVEVWVSLLDKPFDMPLLLDMLKNDSRYRASIDCSATKDFLLMVFDAYVKSNSRFSLNLDEALCKFQ